MSAVLPVGDAPKNCHVTSFPFMPSPTNELIGAVFSSGTSIAMIAAASCGLLVSLLICDTASPVLPVKFFIS